METTTQFEMELNRNRKGKINCRTRLGFSNPIQEEIRNITASRFSNEDPNAASSEKG